MLLEPFVNALRVHAGKVIQLQQRLSQIGGKVKDFFSGGKKKDADNDRMSNLQVGIAQLLGGPVTILCWRIIGQKGCSGLNTTWRCCKAQEPAQLQLLELTRSRVCCHDILAFVLP